jgi:aldose sugar dehydrogenase
MQEKRIDRLLLVVSASLILMLNILVFIGPYIQTVYAQPSIIDSALNVKAVVEGLSSPTSMIFLGDNNMLILEKDGQLRLVSNGVLQEQPVLQVSVSTESERGLLGITTSNGSSGQGTTNVFLYYTEGDPLRNRVYKYLWNGHSLINPDLILDLPAEPGPNHDGGKIIIGPDGYLYAIIGDLNHDGQLQNFPDGPPPDDTGSIFRVNAEDGSAAPDNPFLNNGGNNELSKYYAYGIRNSFGIDFDPLTGNLWDTENGPASYDEINLVKPGFNSGWQTVMGPISLSGNTGDDLVNFPGSQYADPLFSWTEPPAVTDIEFLDSSTLGDRYANNIFVGDINNGNLYFFEVNENRDGIILDTAQQESGLSDLVVDNEEELSAITFGSGFGGITDIETGPNGSLYVLSYDDGIIYEISRSTTTQ